VPTVPSPSSSINAGPHSIRLAGDPGPFAPTLSAQRLADGLYIVKLRIEAAGPAVPPPLTLAWKHPSVDIHATWHPAAGHNRGLQVDWGAPLLTKATSSAPVLCLHSLDGTSRLTFACSEVREPVRLRAGIHEESGEFLCTVEFFVGARTPLAAYEAELLIDTRPVPYHRALGDVSRWWERLPGCEPSPVPEAARQPMYSTWYSFHQQLVPADVEEECRIARQLGCEAVIVDDGWQTRDDRRGYAFCGDWEPERIPDLRAHVDRVHALGMKFLLWYSVPFVGEQSRLFPKFAGRYLAHDARKGASILDPRYPEVREHLIATYERAVREWDLDGLKLDFVDSFHLAPGAPADAGGGRDCASVDEAVNRLLSGVNDRLRALKPDILIEFRQSYTGPLMRRFGNMFRAGDCPNDGIRNRISTLDLRLLAGGSAVHADMLLWHPSDPVESAALQILNVLFAVPQISVRLAALPDDHLEMVRFWLGFWREHRGVLLDGILEPEHPEMLFPVVTAATADHRITAVYADSVVRIGDGSPPEWIVINATRSTGVVLDLARPLPPGDIRIFDCRGREVGRETAPSGAGLRALPVPPAGLACFCPAQIGVIGSGE
jgi:alpha-galactosidase